QVRAVGSTKAHPVDVRVIAATNRDLDRSIADGRFRQDLYYRLNVVRVSLPPLRTRREDIPALVNHFLRRYNRRFRRDVKGITPDALATLSSYDFPGNVRELENVVERAFAMGAREQITLTDLPPLGTGSVSTVAAPQTGTVPRLADVEKDLILRALAFYKDDKEAAASALGISRRTIYRRLKEYGMLSIARTCCRTDTSPADPAGSPLILKRLQVGTPGADPPGHASDASDRSRRDRVQNTPYRHRFRLAPGCDLGRRTGHCDGPLGPPRDVTRPRAPGHCGRTGSGRGPDDPGSPRSGRHRRRGHLRDPDPQRGRDGWGPRGLPHQRRGGRERRCRRRGPRSDRRGAGRRPAHPGRLAVQDALSPGSGPRVREAGLRSARRGLPAALAGPHGAQDANGLQRPVVAGGLRHLVLGAARQRRVPGGGLLDRAGLRRGLRAQRHSRSRGAHPGLGRGDENGLEAARG